MSKSASFKQRHVGGPPRDQPWCWYTLEMLEAPAFHKMSARCRAFIEFLEIRNMHSAGHDNGHLTATYRQLSEWGIASDWIKRTIDEAVVRGLVEIMQHGFYRGYARGVPAEYRLTFRPTKQLSELGAWVWIAPTNEWRRYKPKAPPKAHPKINLIAPENGGAVPPSLGSTSARAIHNTPLK